MKVDVALWNSQMSADAIKKSAESCVDTHTLDNDNELLASQTENRSVTHGAVARTFEQASNPGKSASIIPDANPPPNWFRMVVSAKVGLVKKYRTYRRKRQNTHNNC
jgi:hypothetical protein